MHARLKSSAGEEQRRSIALKVGLIQIGFNNRGNKGHGVRGRQGSDLLARVGLSFHATDPTMGMAAWPLALYLLTLLKPGSGGE